MIRFIVVMGWIAVAVMTLTAAAAPTRFDLWLPAPSGKLPVATTSLHLVDHSRTDPWVPSAGGRELMMSLW